MYKKTKHKLVNVKLVWHIKLLCNKRFSKNVQMKTTTNIPTNICVFSFCCIFISDRKVHHNASYHWKGITNQLNQYYIHSSFATTLWGQASLSILACSCIRKKLSTQGKYRENDKKDSPLGLLAFWTYFVTTPLVTTWM